MIVLFLICEIVLFMIIGSTCFALGHRDGVIDGRLEQKWRMRDARKNNEN